MIKNQIKLQSKEADKANLQSSKRNDLKENDLKERFNQFKQRFNKRYDSAEEEEKRFETFKKNMKKADELTSNARRNNPYSDIKFGFSPLADLTPLEFEDFYLGIVVDDSENFDSKKFTIRSKVNRLGGGSVPEAYDYRDDDCISPVKNQGHCGSSWAFATVAAIESHIMCFKKQKLDLSEQQLISCNTYSSLRNFGCNGGIDLRAYNYIEDYGLTDESHYPYQANDWPCEFSKIDSPLKIKNFSSWNVEDKEEVMKAILYQIGPGTVVIDASYLYLYEEGIIDESYPCDERRNHFSLLVGYGVTIKEDGEAVPYWILKNSWGNEWGEQGYFRILRGKGLCMIDASFATPTLF